MKIKEIKERNRWQVDFGTKIPLVKDPDGNGRMVGRRTSRFKTIDEAKDWTARVLRENRNRDLSMTTTERIVFKLVSQMLEEAGYAETSLIDVVSDWLKMQETALSEFCAQVNASCLEHFSRKLHNGDNEQQ
tara:strand:+ start:88 stop:483 length:396 start_codon:yes stop_codon:yes gene_type:complete